MKKMTDILIEAQEASDARAEEAQRRAPATSTEVRDTVTRFLKDEPEVRRVRVTKMALIDAQEGTWEVCADVYMPNSTIQNLGLPVQREVLDCHEFLVRLDGNLNVVAYGPADSLQGRDSGE